MPGSRRRAPPGFFRGPSMLSTATFSIAAVRAACEFRASLCLLQDQKLFSYFREHRPRPHDLDRMSYEEFRNTIQAFFPMTYLKLLPPKCRLL